MDVPTPNELEAAHPELRVESLGERVATWAIGVFAGAVLGAVSLAVVACSVAITVGFWRWALG